VRRLGTRIGPRAGRRLGSFLIDDDDPTAQHDDDDEQQDEQVEKLCSLDVDQLLASPGCDTCGDRTRPDLARRGVAAVG
jgi:hypothetical protein